MNLLIDFKRKKMFPPRGIEPGFRGAKVKENKSQHLKQ